MADRPHRRGRRGRIAPLDATSRRRCAGSSTDFGDDEIAELAAHEAVTRHDVKAVEYFLRDRLRRWASTASPSWSTSPARARTSTTSPSRSTVQDAVRDGLAAPRSTPSSARLRELALRWAAVPMLARTHGQPATPTTMGKELAVFVHRLAAPPRRACSRSRSPASRTARAGTSPRTSSPRRTSTGRRCRRRFVDGLGLTWNPLTTQIESHDWQVELYGRLDARQRRAAQPLHRRLAVHRRRATCIQVPVGRRDRQLDDAAQGEPDPVRERRGEPRAGGGRARHPRAGRSSPPRWQRDLTDSSTQRNIGVGFGHGLVALVNLARRARRDRRSTAIALAADLDAQPGGAGRGDPDGGPGGDRRRPQRASRTPTSS